MNLIKKGQTKKITVLILLVSVLTAIVMAANETANETIAGNYSVIAKPALATVIGNKNVFDDAYSSTYMQKYNNLSNVEFKTLTQKEMSISLSTGNQKSSVKGFTLDNENYAIHLIACNREKKTCNFRINGLLAKDISSSANSDMVLNDNYTVKVKSVKFDYCNNRRVCDYLLQSYDLVEMELVTR